MLYFDLPKEKIRRPPIKSQLPISLLYFFCSMQFPENALSQKGFLVAAQKSHVKATNLKKSSWRGKRDSNPRPTV